MKKKYKGKILTLLMSLAMVFTMMPMMGGAVYAEPELVTIDSIGYSLDHAEKTAGVVTYQDTSISGDVTIPATVTDEGVEYVVTGIGAGAFNGCTSLETITIPNSVTSIGEGAFYDSGLKSVSFDKDSKLTSIGSYAFSGCKSLGTIPIPNSVTSIKGEAFNYSGLTSVTFESGSTLKEIGYSAFKNCAKLESITIPNSVMSIGSGAFAGSGLKSVSFEENSKLTSIVEYAFDGCTSLGTITIPSSVTSIGSSVFNGCTSLGTITIPSSVTSIGDYAFNGCTSLGTITIPSSVTSIGTSAFENSGLTSVSFENNSGLTSIGSYAFNGCTSLGTITIPSSVTSIGEGAFSGCTSLGTITIPSSVTSIGDYAFNGCTSLGTITIPSSVTSIGTSAFENSGLTSVVIPSTVTTIGWAAFKDCNSLSTVYYVGTKDQWDAMPERDGNWAGGRDDDINVYFIRPAEVPAVEPHVYNGKSQKGVNEGEGYILTGETSATNAGSYTAKATLEDGYIWTDGTTAPKTITWEIKIAAEEVTAPSGKDLTYNGRTQTGVEAGTGYTLSGTVSAANAGTYTATATLKSDTNYTYKWSDETTAPKTITWTIDKANNMLKIKGKTAGVKFSKLKKKNQKLAAGKVITFTGKGQGKMTYKKASGNKKITISRTTGKVTVKKGLKKGTYKVKVKVKAAGNGNYKASVWKTMTFRVRVK